MRWGLVPLIALFSTVAMADWPLTRAEKTNYDETSHYSDVVQYLRDLQAMGAPIQVSTIGTSFDGKAMPMVVASIPPVSSAAEARRLGKPVVYIQANIHAGEVEGKEAALIVLRRLCQAGGKGLLSKIVLVMTPIYNIDGNEKFGPVERTRPEQVGPREAGLRASGQGFDLNRDGIKAESLEMRAVLENVYNKWDPDLMMDLHTTDGTRHGFDLTYLPGSHPASEPDVYKFGYDVLIPAVKKDLQSKYGFAIFAYGDVMNKDGKPAWLTTGPEGRYCTNYVGLRNRIGLLSEAATYIPFKERILATDRFVTSTLEYVASHAKQIQDLSRKADEQVVAWGNGINAPMLAVRTELAKSGEQAVPVEKLAAGEKAPFGRPKTLAMIKMPIYDRYSATRLAKFPMGYLIPATEMKTVELLKRHGIIVEKLLGDWTGTTTRFDIDQVVPAASVFQGHHLTKLEGKYVDATTTASAGWYLVRTAQPLAIVAFEILEPESIDGAVGWEFITGLKTGSAYPVLKVFTPVAVATERQ